jgi:hypothetical protein
MLVWDPCRPPPGDPRGDAQLAWVRGRFGRLGLALSHRAVAGQAHACWHGHQVYSVSSDTRCFFVDGYNLYKIVIFKMTKSGNFVYIYWNLHRAASWGILVKCQQSRLNSGRPDGNGPMYLGRFWAVLIPGRVRQPIPGRFNQFRPPGRGTLLGGFLIVSWVIFKWFICSFVLFPLNPHL